MGITEILKFKELRAKTDRQLLKLIRQELDAGVVLAARAPAQQAAAYARAERLLRRIELLVPRVGGLDAAERAALAARVEGLRALLAEVPPAARGQAAG